MTRSRSVHRPAILLIVGVAVLWGAAGADGTEERATSSDEVRQLLHQRLEVAQEIKHLLQNRLETGQSVFAELHQASMEILGIKLELAESSQERIKLCQKRIKEAERNLERVRSQFKLAVATRVDVLQAESQLLRVRIALEREKGN